MVSTGEINLNGRLQPYGKASWLRIYTQSYMVVYLGSYFEVWVDVETPDGEESLQRFLGEYAVEDVRQAVLTNTCLEVVRSSL